MANCTVDRSGALAGCILSTERVLIHTVVDKAHTDSEDVRSGMVRHWALLNDHKYTKNCCQSKCPAGIPKQTDRREGQETLPKQKIVVVDIHFVARMSDLKFN